jgi:hypothetical protein
LDYDFKKKIAGGLLCHIRRRRNIFVAGKGLQRDKRNSRLNRNINIRADSPETVHKQSL